MKGRLKGRVVLHVLGGAFILLGLGGIVAESEPWPWLVWFAGAAILHDAVLVPAVLLAGALTARLPAAGRRPVRVALIVAGALVLVALAMINSTGRRPDNPSILPLAYGRGLAVLLALVAAVTAVRLLWNRGRLRNRVRR
ncbi:hypothetical protein [Spirillospora sp. NPDC047279]|uniref:hypothetical protein n=1 Tax=Spirillospora sp. NPDC047279 TaxID=3155478 RepID=UPI00340D2CA5